MTGEKSGLLVVDVDPRTGGDETLAELLREHGPLPPTPEDLTGGTGRPFVTTDTAAALAAAEIGADAVLKATQVDGVYSADPKSDPAAEFYPQLSYDRVIDERLKVMDLSAVDLCQANDIPIVVFSLHESGHMKRIIRGEAIGTVIAKSS